MNQDIQFDLIYVIDYFSLAIEKRALFTGVIHNCVYWVETKNQYDPPFLGAIYIENVKDYEDLTVFEFIEFMSTKTLKNSL
jgi:hypothetical protein